MDRMHVISQVPVTKYMVASEMSQVEHWVIEKFKHEDQYHFDLPFSFSYEEQPSHQLLKNWDLQRHTQQLDEHRTENKLIYTDTVTGLVFSCLMVEYHHFPIVEWTLSFRNTGSENTLIIAEIRALDTKFTRKSEGEYVLNHHTGSPCTPTDYQLHQTLLEPKISKEISTSGGRSSNSNLPYFNLQWPEGGVIIAIGWPGQWSVKFDRDEGPQLRVQAGQELTHFSLHPDEEGSPLIAMQFWDTDRLRARNTWRYWMLTQNLPRPYGQPVAPQTAACSSHQYAEMINANEENQKMFIDGYLREGLQLDHWWMDKHWNLGS
jgi:alpha-galactosidase